MLPLWESLETPSNLKRLPLTLCDLSGLDRIWPALNYTLSCLLLHTAVRVNLGNVDGALARHAMYHIL
jgi:hypothetical protein